MRLVVTLFLLALAAPVRAGTPTLLPPLFPHQYRYDLGAIGCGVLDRSGSFVETFQCAVILTFNTSVTATSASGGQSLHVESIHYQATAQLGASLSGRQVQFSGTTTGMPCYVVALGLYDPALYAGLPLTASWSTQDWRENITPGGTAQLECFVHAPYPQP